MRNVVACDSALKYLIFFIAIYSYNVLGEENKQISERKREGLGVWELGDELLVRSSFSLPPSAVLPTTSCTCVETFFYIVEL